MNTILTMPLPAVEYVSECSLAKLAFKELNKCSGGLLEEGKVNATLRCEDLRHGIKTTCNMKK